jgi:hypothetical protein
MHIAIPETSSAIQTAGLNGRHTFLSNTLVLVVHRIFLFEWRWRFFCGFSGHKALIIGIFAAIDRFAPLALFRLIQ